MISVHTRGKVLVFFRNFFKYPFISCFEPLSKNFELLKSKKCQDNICFNIAISNFSGETVFYENKIAHTNSLFEVNKKSKESVKISVVNTLNYYILHYKKLRHNKKI